MRFFWRYIFPAIFGLLIYASIRLVTDVPSGYQFWKRPLYQNMIEIGFVLIMAYVFDLAIRYAIRRFSKQRIQRSGVKVMKELLVVLLISVAFTNPIVLLIHYLANDPVDWADITIANIQIGLYILLYYSVARANHLIRSYIEQKTQIEKLKNIQLETELKFLKAQYHPHFLFNALNTIYFQMDEDVAGAKETVTKFSELLRYQLFNQQQLVPMQQELDHLRNFIFVQKERTSQRLQLDVSLDPGLNSEKIYPLLLLPLVENAFKYVGGAYHMCIQACRDEGSICFRVRNSIPVNQVSKGTGLGLEHLQRRLEILYPGSHQLHIKKSNDCYEAELKLQAL